jgi:hypothetical protein
MDKILSDYRRPIGNFEVIDFTDRAVVAKMRDQVAVDVPVELHWTWSYDSDMEELRRLYEKGKGGQWNAQTDLDWSTPVERNSWMLNPEASMLANVVRMMGKDEATQQDAAFDEVTYLLSQLLHGEQAALQLCGQLTNVCTEIDQKYYAASQVIDEARHIEVFSKFLLEKAGTIYPIGGALKTLLDILLQAEGMQKKVLGMQTLFEGMAVGIMDTLRRESRNPLVTNMLHRVEQDEARHAAFGCAQHASNRTRSLPGADGGNGRLGLRNPRDPQRRSAIRDAQDLRWEIRLRPRAGSGDDDLAAQFRRAE